MTASSMPSASTVKAMVAAQVAAYDPIEEARKASRIGSDANSLWYANTLKQFENLLIEPVIANVLFSGGHDLDCWVVTDGYGPYRVIYVHTDDTFSLTVDTVFGPADIGVHGNAIKVFESV